MNFKIFLGLRLYYSLSGVMWVLMYGTLSTSDGDVHEYVHFGTSTLYCTSKNLASKTTVVKCGPKNDVPYAGYHILVLPVVCVACILYVSVFVITEIFQLEF